MLSRVAHHVVASAVCAAAAGTDEAGAITPSSTPPPPPRRMLLSRKRAEPLPSDVVPLRVDRQVHPLPQELARVRDSIATAVANRDFREAALLQDLLHVVEQKPSLTAEACAPEHPEDARDFFLREGFVCVENCFTQENLCRLQEAWRRAQEEPQKLWEEARGHAKYLWAAQGVHNLHLHAPTSLRQTGPVFGGRVDSSRSRGVAPVRSAGQPASSLAWVGCSVTLAVAGQVLPVDSCKSVDRELYECSRPSTLGNMVPGYD